MDPAIIFQDKGRQGVPPKQAPNGGRSSHGQTVRGVKALQSSTVYICAVILSFILFHFNKENFLQGLCARVDECLLCLRTRLWSWCIWTSDWYNWVVDEKLNIRDYMVLIVGTLSVLAICSAIKFLQILSIRREIIANEKERLRLKEESERADDPPCETCGQPLECIHRLKCEKITNEEFEHQTRVTTRQEIRKLTTSEQYQRLMAAKGADPAKWNWQLNDKQEGFFPVGQEELKDNEVLTEEDFAVLEKQLIKIEEDLRKEGKAPESVRKILSNFKQRPHRERRVSGRSEGLATKRTYV